MKVAIYNFRPDDKLNNFPKEFPALRWAVIRSDDEMAAQAGDADILILSNRVCTPALGDIIRSHRGPSLRWIHFVSAGIERGLGMGLPKGVAVSNAAGVKAQTVAEHAVTLLLAVGRRIPELGRAQHAREWARVRMHSRMRSLERQTICIFGMGAIGREIARKLKAFDATVIAVSRAGASGGDFDVVYGRHDIDAALAMSDASIVCTTSNAESLRMIGPAQFAAMKPGALIVNVARGELIDESAMIAALRSGQLGGAGLDVTEVEPLSQESPLWDMANVVLTPHVSGGGSTGYDAHVALFAKNLANFRAGRPLASQLIACTE